ncbi:MAG: hypothetical protein WB425_01525 [Terracidiphilus sp.]
MHALRFLPLAALLASLPVLPAQAPQAAAPPLPEVHQLMKEVGERQKLVNKVQENYTYTSMQTIQDIDAKGKVTKTEAKEFEVFFVHGKQIDRLVKKDGKPLTDEEQQKESERVTKAVEAAENPPAEKHKGEGFSLSMSQMLDLMDVHNQRRESYRGRPTIVFDFIGRKNAKTHGMEEDVSKKIQGTIWIDEADRTVTHVDVTFNDNFHVAGGLVANVEKGSNFHLDQALVNGEIWLPTGSEGTVTLRLFLVKGIRQHFTEQDYDFKRYHVEAEQSKQAAAVVEKKP